MAKRRKKHHEEHIDETWLIPYADMLTLLLALFIVLFAVSSVDAERYEQMMITFNETFQGGRGLLEQPVPTPVNSGMEEVRQGTSQEDGRAVSNERRELEELKQQIDSYIEENSLSSELQTSLSADGLLLTILDQALFHSGSAEVRQDALDVVQQISGLLISDPPRRIVVAGHTDNVPIHNAEYRSNWDLSADRALNFTKILLENEDLDPSLLSATGYSEYQPVASNDTPEGRERNRRVEVLILPNESLDNR
ncbi:flagellar motor protein MotB [Alkalihalobacillus oceani]|uniref:flagellar motor protein MotB n=1 Tax=Halalkalibacter oceani TaxID=1653776 RepID=UPI00203B158A|nr:flagellar motor protein MotB [Halalkalibacter oceani]MCM3760654.1 flagellar motor protein MotB [Halalkalibacter oceani]